MAYMKDTNGRRLDSIAVPSEAETFAAIAVNDPFDPPLTLDTGATYTAVVTPDTTYPSDLVWIDGSAPVVAAGMRGIVALTQLAAYRVGRLVGTWSTAVTPAAPTFTDVSGTASDTYTIPSTAHVIYSVGGVVKAAGVYAGTGTVTITAAPAEGWTISGTDSWSHAFSTIITVTPTAPTFDDGTDTYTITATTGVIYSVGGVVTAAGTYSVGDVSTTVNITAAADTGYSLTGTTSWTGTFTASAIPGVTVPTGSMAIWKDARNNAASELVEVSYLGDSTGIGETTDAAAGVMHPIALKLRALAIADGLTDGGIGNYSRDADATAPNPMAYVGITGKSGDSTTSSSNGTALIELGDRCIDTPGDYIALQGEGSVARITYTANGLLRGNFTYTVDGGSPVAVPISAIADTDGYKTITVNLGTDALHTIRFDAVGGEVPGPPTISVGWGEGSAGTLPAGTYYYVATYAPDTGGETVASAQCAVTITSGQTALVFVTGPAPQRVSVKLYRGTVSGGPYQLIATMPGNANGTTNFSDDGTATPGANPPTVSTAGLAGLNLISPHVDWLRPSGLVWQRDAVSGAQSTTASGIGYYYRLGLRSGVEGTHPAARRVRLAIWALGINDQQQSTDKVETLRTNMQAWVPKAQAAGATPVIVIPHYEAAANANTVDAGQTLTRAERFRQVHIDVAAANGLACVDLGSGGALGPSANWVASGYVSNMGNPHLKILGYQTQAAFLWNNLLKL